MKLRYRLFLWIGIIFLVAFTLSLFLENYITDKNVKNAEYGVRSKILGLHEETRQHLEEYLHVTLTEDQAKVDALLFRLAQNSHLTSMLFLDPKYLQIQAPTHSAYLFKNALWADFIQSTYHNQLTSLLIPLDSPLKTATRVEIDDTLSWVLLENDARIGHPYLGVRLHPMKIHKDANLSLFIDDLIESEEGLTVLFDPKQLLTYSDLIALEKQKKPLPSWIDIEAFVASMNHAISYMRLQEEKWGKKRLKAGILQEIQEQDAHLFSTKKEKNFDIYCLEEEGEVLNTRVIELLERKDQALMISFLAMLFPENIFGKTFLGPWYPQGIARFTGPGQMGKVVFTKEVFFSKKAFEDQKYYADHPATFNCDRVGSSIAVVSTPLLDKVFIGNTLELSEAKNSKPEGYLTIGVDADTVLEDLVLSLHQGAFLVHGATVISAYTKEGKKIEDPRKTLSFKKQMLEEKSGLLEWEGNTYYFIHMMPFKNLDLHFFTLELESKAFALVHYIQKETLGVIKHVSLSMRITAIAVLIFVFILLNNVSKRITKPITALAKVTEKVAKGQLENIELPKSQNGRHDEITTLCNSFGAMITGLKEKEKVKGVLNKIVSPEIAQEILKIGVHLGGEERKVTVLFADIRDFTKMSTNKAPHEVIEMLNSCMTKVSHVIDSFGGVIDKYVGDEVMALFGAPLAKEDSALNAVLCSLKIIEVLQEWNKERQEKGLSPIEMGIGIHTGLVVVGNMGAENRLNYTVIGNSVNLAARLCSTARGMEILISKETLEQPHVKENILVEDLPPKALKGFAVEYVLFRVKGVKK